MVTFCLPAGLFAQGAGQQSSAASRASYTISGIITEGGSGEGVPYASAALIRKEDGQSIAGAVADLDGKFIISGVRAGAYTVQVSLLGYETFNSGEILVGPDNPEVNLGVLALQEDAVKLDEVVVQGQRNLIEERVDRTIFNAENDKTTVGGDATDVLRRVPMLSVDLDGNVSMRGSGNILVLINGRQSAIVATNIAEALKQIPAEEIKTVEVITSPSAKYDAEGTGGVINIITKKNNLQGASLNVNSSAGLRGSNLGVNASLKRGKMSWTLGGFGRAGYNILGSFENTQQLRDAEGNETATIQQQADTRNSRLFGRYNLGWDYDIDKYNFMTASISFGVRDFRSFQDGLRSDTFLEDMLQNSIVQDVRTDNLSNNIDLNYNYTKTFEKPQKEFSISGLYSRNNRTNDFVQALYNGTLTDIVSRVKNENSGINEEFTVQLDYVSPLGKKSGQILEYGAKNILRRVTSDFQRFRSVGEGPFEPIEGINFNNELRYDQNVTAAYASYTTAFLTNYTLKAGLRYEYTTISADFRNSELEADIPSYGTFVPSVNIGRRLKNGNMIKAAYNRRIQRPSLNFLNPNIDDANPLQISQGNPLLDPELTDNFELGYSTFIKGSSLNFSSFYRSTTGSIQAVRTTLADDIIFTTFENIGNEQAVGLSIFSNIQLSGKFSLNGSVEGYYAMLDNGLEDPLFAASNTGWVFSGRLFGNYTLPKDWQIQLFTFARGRQVQLQGTAGGFGVYGLNLNKQFNERRGSIGFGAENFFTSEFIIRNELRTPTIMQNSTVGLRNMNFKVNFSYRIGKLSTEGPSRRKRRGVTNDDLKSGSSSSEGAVGGGGEGGR